MTIAPPPFFRMRATSAFMAVQCARKFTANCSSMSSSLVVWTVPGDQQCVHGTRGEDLDCSS
ncbi:hypothetical protein [Streptomyces rochei]|uniref:hypothetical protein n=2 Tax=Streptomyces rochei TaxID=1928 RepID=UPI0036A6A2DE